MTDARRSRAAAHGEGAGSGLTDHRMAHWEPHGAGLGLGGEAYRNEPNCHSGKAQGIHPGT